MRIMSDNVAKQWQICNICTFCAELTILGQNKDIQGILCPNSRLFGRFQQEIAQFTQFQAIFAFYANLPILGQISVKQAIFGRFCTIITYFHLYLVENSGKIGKIVVKQQFQCLFLLFCYFRLLSPILLSKVGILCQW